MVTFYIQISSNTYLVRATRSDAAAIRGNELILTRTRHEGSKFTVLLSRGETSPALDSTAVSFEAQRSISRRIQNDWVPRNRPLRTVLHAENNRIAAFETDPCQDHLVSLTLIVMASDSHFYVARNLCLGSLRDQTDFLNKHIISQKNQFPFILSF